MQIKDFLHDTMKYSLDEILELYISRGSIFKFNILEEVNWEYLKIKESSDDYSGDEEGRNEIFSFDLSLTDGTVLELKLYYKEKRYFGDSIFIHNNQPDIHRFEKLLDHKLMSYNLYIHNIVDDEGAILLKNGVISRFKLEDAGKIIYQIEGNFSLYPDFSSARERNIKENMVLIEP